MRKALLLWCLAPMMVFAQKPMNGNDETATMTSNPQGEYLVKTNQGNDDGPLIPSVAPLREWLYDIEQIGETEYDLQVNSALANRIIDYGDGRISVVWTLAIDDSPFLTRGTGYAHYDGSEWTDMPLSRLENDRAGWCNIGTVEKNGVTVEFVVSHHASSDPNASSGGLYIMMNSGIGSTDWSIVEEYKVGEDGPFWPRAVGKDGAIHIYAAANTSTEPVIDGIRRPNSYYRYDVATESFTAEQVILPGYDSSRVAYGRSDSYQMTSNGNTIAIVAGGSGQDLFLHKSSDNGDNWTTTIVDSFPIPRFDGNVLTNGDTLLTNSGSVEVLLDDNDNAHVFWALSRVLDDVEGDSSWSFFPGTNGIAYWSETNTEAQVVAEMPDINENDQLDIFNDQTALEGGARYASNTLACFPDASIDENGNVYLIYSAPNEEALSPDGPLYRDVFVVYSTDGGATWSEQAQSLIESKESEDVFAHVAPTADGQLSVTWQRDDFPGNNVQNGHSPTNNKIMFASIDTDLILNDELVWNRSSIDENNATYQISAYPNPASEFTRINLNLDKSNTVNIEVVNMMGKVVYTNNLGELSSGLNQMDITTSNFSKGVYIYKVNVGETAATGRLVVE